MRIPVHLFFHGQIIGGSPLLPVSGPINSIASCLPTYTCGESAVWNNTQDDNELEREGERPNGAISSVGVPLYDYREKVSYISRSYEKRSGCFNKKGTKKKHHDHVNVKTDCNISLFFYKRGEGEKTIIEKC